MRRCSWWKSLRRIKTLFNQVKNFTKPCLLGVTSTYCIFKLKLCHRSSLQHFCTSADKILKKLLWEWTTILKCDLWSIWASFLPSKTSPKLSGKKSSNSRVLPHCQKAGPSTLWRSPASSVWFRTVSSASILGSPKKKLSIGLIQKLLIWKKW